jgi:3-phenylpropionate/cinnamic acid dioxygenase small subunit
MHVVTTISIEVEGDTAAAQSCWLFYGDTVTVPTLRGLGRYDDLVRRTPDGWRVARRTVVPG